MLVAGTICGILLLCVLMLFAAAAGNELRENSYPEHPVGGVVGALVMLTALAVAVIGTLHLGFSAMDGKFLTMATKEERQIIEKVRTTKKIQRLKKELYELESRSTEAMQ